MGKTLYESAKDFFARLEKSEEANRFLKKRDEIFQFDVSDGEPFYIEVKGGKISVIKGRTENTSIYEVTPVEIDSDTLNRIFEGRIRPYRAIQEKKFSIVAGTYEGSLLTVLMRIAQDIVRDEVINNYKWE